MALQPALLSVVLLVQAWNWVLQVGGGMFLASDGAQLPPVTFGATILKWFVPPPSVYPVHVPAGTVCDAVATVIHNESLWVCSVALPQFVPVGAPQLHVQLALPPLRPLSRSAAVVA